MTTNEWGATKRMWAKWSDQAQHVFNETYHTVLEGPALIRGGGLTEPTSDWDVIAWNAAFIAACAVDGYRIDGAVDERLEDIVEAPLRRAA